MWRAMRRDQLPVVFILFVYLSAFTVEALKTNKKSSASKSEESYRRFLQQKKSAMARELPPVENTRNPAALFILDSEETDYSNLGVDNLAIVANSITEEEGFSDEMRETLAGGIWLQDFNWTYSNKLDVVDSHTAAALISLLVASGTKHCTSGLCLRDVSEAWQRGAIERGLLERLATSSFKERPSNPGGVIPQLVGNLGWGQFKMKKRPDNSSAILFKAATAVAKTAFSDLMKRNEPAVMDLMQKKNLQGIIDLSYALDVTPFLEKLQKYTLVLKLGLNNHALTERLTLVFKNAFLQTFRLVMPDATTYPEANVLEELGWRYEAMSVFYDAGYGTAQSFSGHNSYFS